MRTQFTDYDFSRYLPAKRVSGDQIICLCPFHEDTRPSFSGNSRTGLWICHACGAKGNWWQFLKRLSGTSKNEQRPLT